MGLMAYRAQHPDSVGKSDEAVMLEAWHRQGRGSDFSTFKANFNGINDPQETIRFDKTDTDRSFLDRIEGFGGSLVNMGEEGLLKGRIALDSTLSEMAKFGGGMTDALYNLTAVPLVNMLTRGKTTVTPEFEFSEAAEDNPWEQDKKYREHELTKIMQEHAKEENDGDARIWGLKHLMDVPEMAVGVPSFMLGVPVIAEANKQMAEARNPENAPDSVGELALDTATRTAAVGVSAAKWKFLKFLFHKIGKEVPTTYTGRDLLRKSVASGAAMAVDPAISGGSWEDFWDSFTTGAIFAIPDATGFAMRKVSPYQVPVRTGDVVQSEGKKYQIYQTKRAEGQLLTREVVEYTTPNGQRMYGPVSKDITALPIEKTKAIDGRSVRFIGAPDLHKALAGRMGKGVFYTQTAKDKALVEASKQLSRVLSSNDAAESLTFKSYLAQYTNVFKATPEEVDAHTAIIKGMANYIGVSPNEFITSSIQRVEGTRYEDWSKGFVEARTPEEIQRDIDFDTKHSEIKERYTDTNDPKVYEEAEAHLLEYAATRGFTVITYRGGSREHTNFEGRTEPGIFTTDAQGAGEYGNVVEKFLVKADKVLDLSTPEGQTWLEEWSKKYPSWPNRISWDATTDLTGVPEGSAKDIVASGHLFAYGPIREGLKGSKGSVGERSIALQEDAKAAGFSVLIMPDANGASGVKPSTIVLDEGKIKSAKPFTQNDMMEDIPLSERMNEGVKDTRYQAEKAKNIWDVPNQDITSADTSINSGKLPAVFGFIRSRLPHLWKPGMLNADIGGGRFDNATKDLEGSGIRNLIFDPWKRTSEHNISVIAQISNHQADTATVSNVLNVIGDKVARQRVIRQAADAVKEESGVAIFSLYEGDGSGIGKETSKGWQENRKTQEYIEEIKPFFEAVERVGGTNIVASKPRESADAKTLFQKDSSSSNPRGATEFHEDGRAIIRAFEGADFSTAMHELVHVFTKYIKEDDKRIVDSWLEVEKGKEWSREHHEKFASAFETFLSSGEAPTPKLKKVFDNMKRWMQDIYKESADSPIGDKMSDEMRRAFERFVGRKTVAQDAIDRLLARTSDMAIAKDFAQVLADFRLKSKDEQAFAIEFLDKQSHLNITKLDNPASIIYALEEVGRITADRSGQERQTVRSLEDMDLASKARLKEWFEEMGGDPAAFQPFMKEKLERMNQDVTALEESMLAGKMYLMSQFEVLHELSKDVVSVNKETNETSFNENATDLQVAKFLRQKLLTEDLYVAITGTQAKVARATTAGRIALHREDVDFLTSSKRVNLGDDTTVAETPPEKVAEFLEAMGGRKAARKLAVTFDPSAPSMKMKNGRKMAAVLKGHINNLKAHKETKDAFLKRLTWAAVEQRTAGILSVPESVLLDYTCSTARAFQEMTITPIFSYILGKAGVGTKFWKGDGTVPTVTRREVGYKMYGTWMGFFDALARARASVKEAEKVQTQLGERNVVSGGTELAEVALLNFPRIVEIASEIQQPTGNYLSGDTLSAGTVEGPRMYKGSVDALFGKEAMRGKVGSVGRLVIDNSFSSGRLIGFVMRSGHSGFLKNWMIGAERRTVALHEAIARNTPEADIPRFVEEQVRMLGERAAGHDVHFDPNLSNEAIKTQRALLIQMEREVEQRVKYPLAESELGPLGKKLAEGVNNVIPLKLLFPTMVSPINLLKYAINSTPIGLAQKSLRAELTAGGWKSQHALARLIVGTAIASWAFSLASSGKVTPMHKYDEKKSAQMLGVQEYSYLSRETKKSYGFRRYDPFSTIFSIGADANKLLKDGMIYLNNDSKTSLQATKDLETLISYAWYIPWKYFMDRSWNQTFTQLVDGLLDAASEGNEKKLEMFFQQLGKSFLPVSGAARSVSEGWGSMRDPFYRRTTDFLDNFHATYFQRQDVGLLRDILGSTIPNEGSILSNKITTIRTDSPFRKLQYQLKMNFGPVHKDVLGVELTRHQLDAVREVLGKMNTEEFMDTVAAKLIESDAPMGLAEKVLKDVYSTRLRLAKLTVLNQVPNMTEEVFKVKKLEMDRLSEPLNAETWSSETDPVKIREALESNRSKLPKRVKQEGE